MYEPIFTQYTIGLLADAGELKTHAETYEKKEMAGNTKAIENKWLLLFQTIIETVDLYISLFYDTDNITCAKADI